MRPLATARHALLALLATAALACAGGVTEPVEGFSVRTTPTHIELVNESPAPVHYFAYSRAAMAYTDFVFTPPCTSLDPHCPTVAPGELVRRTYEELGGRPEHKEFFVSYWSEVTNGSGAVVATETRTILVTR
jgi:hypothetical protein